MNNGLGMKYLPFINHSSLIMCLEETEGEGETPPHPPIHPLDIKVLTVCIFSFRNKKSFKYHKLM